MHRHAGQHGRERWSSEIPATDGSNRERISHWTTNLAADSFIRPYPPIGYVSSLTPLLSALHTRLTEYEDAVSYAQNVRRKYGDALGCIEPPSVDMLARMERTSLAFDAVMRHVDAVDTHLSQDYVVLHRDTCGPTNAFYRSRAIPEQDEQRTVRSRSPILANATELSVTFRPFPSTEVLLQSPILAHSAELRALSASANK